VVFPIPFFQIAIKVVLQTVTIEMMSNKSDNCTAIKHGGRYATIQEGFAPRTYPAIFFARKK
jgi:hypothetical protein